MIAATNRDLQEAIRDGEFRSDLFYRLNVIPVHLPALREHADDIPLLVHHFVESCAARLGRDPLRVSDDAMECLMRHTWPGNVRELENAVERLVVLNRSGAVEREALPASLQTGDDAAARIVPGTLQEMERRRVADALRDSAGNKKLAAKKLGIHRSTLYAKLRRHGLLERARDSSRGREGEQAVSESETTLITS